MNTVQSNREEASFSSHSSPVGKNPASSANPGPPTAPNQIDDPPFVIKPLEQLLAMRDWATTSIDYVKRRNYLAQSEKLKVNDTIGWYYKQLTSRIEFLQANPTTSGAVFISELGWAHNEQEKQNRSAVYYEFPPFSLPYEPVHRPVEVTGVMPNDSLAAEVWKGDRFDAIRLEAGQWPDVDDLVIMHFRSNRRVPRVAKIGWFKEVNETCFLLHYQSPRLKKTYPDWIIPVRFVVQVSVIHTISRNRK